MAEHAHKYGLVMVGQIDGKTVIVAPYVEGRVREGDVVYAVAKGDAKHKDPVQDQNAEFREETGIDPVKLQRRGYGNASVLTRFRNADVTYNTYDDNVATLHSDVVVVNNIADLIPHLKGQRIEGQFKTAETLARERGLPGKTEMLAFLHERGLPREIADMDAFRGYIADKEKRTSLQPALNTLRAHWEVQGWVSDDTGIKVDNKIAPLNYFQEGSRLMEPEAYMQGVRDYAQKSPEYGVSMLGNATHKGQTHAVLNAVVEAEKVMGKIPSVAATGTAVGGNR